MSLRKIILRCSGAALTALLCSPNGLLAQQSYTWDQLRDKFKSTNPTLRAGEIGIDESKAQEITAYLRPNPDFSASLDQLNPFSNNPCATGDIDCYRPFGLALPLFTASYLHERQHKRELRQDSAQKANDHRRIPAGGPARGICSSICAPRLSILCRPRPSGAGKGEPRLLR